MKICLRRPTACSASRPCRRCFADAGYKGHQFHNALKKILPHCERRSSSARIRPRDSWCCPSAGSLSGRWRGSTAAADSPRIGRISIAQRSHFCASLQFGSCFENFLILTDVSGQALSSHARGGNRDASQVLDESQYGKRGSVFVAIEDGFLYEIIQSNAANMWFKARMNWEAS
jgi:hypothetical protein